MPIVATAGHVDHGKSTLVQALTGRDPDRWAEEKERGLTIDLGFAWADIAGEPVGFVDVPGHERFIKNMLAGVGGLDVALFVVAADEGWMPQSEEHMAVLDLLEVSHGVIALTRADLADEEMLELVRLEVEEKLQGTSLEGSPIVAVSAITGVGMEQLHKAIADALQGAGVPRDIGRPRLWVDRSFVISGAGVVVTGTLVDGTLAVGQSVDLWPGPRRVRIRGLQTHESEVAEAAPGSRVAANITGLDRDDVARGALLTGLTQRAQSTRFLATARPVRTHDEISDRGAYHLHAGSGAWAVRVRTVAAEGRQHSIMVTARDSIPLSCGDRFVLRETGRRAVVAGGRILDPRPGGRSSGELADAASGLAAALDQGPDDLATALLIARGIAAVAELQIDSGGGTPGEAVIGGGRAMALPRARVLAERISRQVDEFHAANPLRPGIPKASLASGHRVDPGLLDAVLKLNGDIVDDGATVRSASHGAGWSESDEAEWERAETTLRESGLAAPRSGQLGLRPELLHAAVRHGRLTKVADDLVYLPSQLDEIVARLGNLPEGFSVAEFRDEMKISRRQAVPLLEWLDAGGITSRRGDQRTLRRSQQQ